MNKQELHKDLVTEYDELNKKINSLDAFINSLDFEEQVPDFIERELLKGKRHCMRNYRDNLKARIKCIECQIKKEENDRKAIDDWMNMKGKVVNTPCGQVHLINTDEQDCQVCGDAIATHHCGQDASCQVGDGSVAVEKPVITGESLKQLMDYQVIGVCEPGFPCEGCVQDHYNTPCVKVELVCGYMLCLAPLPNSIVTE